MLSRAFMLVAGLTWLLLGLWCFLRLQALGLIGIVSTGATGDIELRALYGGMQIGFGALMIAGALRSAWQRGVLLAMAFMIGATFLGRLGGLLMSGSAPEFYTSGALLFEGSAALATLWFLRRS